MTFYKETDFQDFIIGRISEDWNIESLQDVLVLLKNGLTVKQNKEGNGYPITRIETISQERIDSDRIGYSPEISERDVEEYKLIKGDILFSHINSLAHIGKTALYEGTPELLLHGMNLLLLRPNKEKIHSEYLLYILKLLKIRNVFWSMSKKAVNQASINQTELGRLRIPVPSVEEQRGVVGVLGVVDSAIELVDRVIWKTERLKKGLMQTLLTRGIGHKEYKDTPIGKIPKDWNVARINQISEVHRGASPRPIGDSKYFSETGRGWIRISDVTNAYKYLSKTSQYLSELGESKSVKVNQRDLVMSICATIGKPVIIDMKACIHDGFVVFRNLSKDVDTEFLFYLLQKNELRFRNMKQTGTQGNLNTTLVGETFIPVPSLSEQKQIADILSTVDEKIELERKEKTRLEKVKRGLMDLLLTGKVRVKVD